MTDGAAHTCYISGPMRGHPAFNFPAFYEAECGLEVGGWTVHNPARYDVEVTGFDPITDTDAEMFDVEQALRHDIEVILGVDAVFVLPGWRDSVGARLEVGVAQAIGKPVYTMSGLRITELIRTVVTDTLA